MERLGGVIWLILMALIARGIGKAKQAALKRQQAMGQQGAGASQQQGQPRPRTPDPAKDTVKKEAAPRSTPPASDARARAFQSAEDRQQPARPAPAAQARWTAPDDKPAERSMIPQVSSSPVVQAIVMKTILDRPRSAKRVRSR